MIGSKANIGSSFPVQFLVKNVSNYIVKAGMFGTVNIATDNGEVGIAIPASVVVGTSNKPQVYVVKNGKATAINITISTKNAKQSDCCRRFEGGRYCHCLRSYQCI
ncbi:MAG: hypothetical protein IPN49_15835 [Saprospiraceae bacterium]|nr:hypothetical protein [Saprospiraceae bacterium]